MVDNVAVASWIYLSLVVINKCRHDNWLDISYAKRKTVNNERTRIGLDSHSGRSRERENFQERRGRRNEYGPGRGHRNSSLRDMDPIFRNQLNQLKTENAQYKRTIDGFKSELVNIDLLYVIRIDIEEDAENAFGGKSKKSKSF